jgi:hypothetical protein
MRLLRAVGRKTGLLSFLESRRDRRAFLYLRSLFSIYDVDDMARLDVPWWTFNATRYIDEFLRQRNGTATVFEYGPGASTVWLSRRAHRVAYAEHDEGFAEVVQRLVSNAGNVHGTLARPVCCDPEAIACPSGRRGYENCDFADYVHSIREAGGPFDLIVIDGRARSACLKEAVKHLKPDGAILFDNSRRKRYRWTIEEAGMGTQVFRGLAPALPYVEETTILRFEAK